MLAFLHSFEPLKIPAYLLETQDTVSHTLKKVIHLLPLMPSWSLASSLPLAYESEYTKLIIPLIIFNLLFACFYWQTHLWEGINKSQADPDSSSSNYIPVCPWPSQPILITLLPFFNSSSLTFCMQICSHHLLWTVYLRNFALSAATSS